MAEATKKTQASQEVVPIQEIRDGVVILEDGGMRAVLLASSLNFALKSYDEQSGVVLQFQNFLNSLDFPVQFFIESRDLDIRPYIALLEERFQEVKGDLIKIQTREYIGFIKAFTENENIMSKSFFVIVPYDPAIIKVKKGGVSEMLPFGKNKKEKKTIDREFFEEVKNQLDQRVAVVEQGLIRTGVRTVRLGSEELIELYYKIFNPGDLEKPIPLYS